MQGLTFNYHPGCCYHSCCTKAAPQFLQKLSTFSPSANQLVSLSLSASSSVSQSVDLTVSQSVNLTVSQSVNLTVSQSVSHSICYILNAYFCISFQCPTVFVYRCQLYVQRYMKSTVHLPVTVSLSLPVVNLADHKLSQLSKHKLYIQFRRHPSYCLVSDLYSKIKCCISILGCLYAFWGHSKYMNKYILACRSHEILAWCKQLHIQL